MTLTEWVALTEQRGETITRCGIRESPGDLTFWEAWKDRDMSGTKGGDHVVRHYTYYAIFDGEELILFTDDFWKARRTWTREAAFLYPEEMERIAEDAGEWALAWSVFRYILHLVEEASR